MNSHVSHQLEKEFQWLYQSLSVSGKDTDHHSSGLSTLLAILDLLPCGLGIVDREGRILYINPEFSRITGYLRTDIPTIDEWFRRAYPDPRLRSELFAAWEEDRTTRDRGGRKIKITSKDGTSRVLDARATFMTDGGVVFSFLDATEKDRAHDERQAAEQRLRTFLANVDDMVYFQRLDGRITLLNDSVAAITGYTAEEFSADPSLWRRIVHPDDVAASREFFAQHPEGVESLEVEYRLRTRRGEWRWMLTRMVGVRDEHGCFIGYNCIDRDITARKMQEQETVRMHKMDSLALLAGGIAHDFNNILTGILGNINLVATHVSDDRAANELLTEAEDACLKAKALTGQLLSFARGNEPVKQAGDIAQVVRKEVAFALRGSMVHCHFQATDDPWPVEFNAGQLAQVVNNLALNARQAMPEGGELRVWWENLEMKVPLGPLPLAPGRWVRVVFEDTGSGIPEECLNRVFDPYFTTKPEGNGLGLASAYSIIRQHRGHISVDSEAEGGARFTIYLPAGNPTPGEVAVDVRTGDPGPGRVLLVEEEQLVQEISGAMLRHLGFEVQSVASLQGAIDCLVRSAAEGLRFDCVILDLDTLGERGTLRVLEQIRRVQPNLPVVVSSGYALDPVVREHQRHGFHGALVKPFHLNDLQQVLVDVRN